MNQERDQFSYVEVTIGIRLRHSPSSHRHGDEVSYSRTHTSPLNLTNDQSEHIQRILNRELASFISDAVTELRPTPGQ